MKVVNMEQFSKVVIMLIVIDIGFKSDIVEGGRGINVQNEKVVYQPQNFPGLPPIFQGFPNWNFPGQQNPGQPSNIPGFPGIPFFGFPPPSPGGGDSPSLPPGFNLPLLPLFPFLPYFRYGPPRYCIRFIGCIPLPKFLPPAQGQPPQATPGVSPTPDQGPLAPSVQPSPINPSPSQPPPAQTNPLQPPPVQSPPAETPPVPPPMAQTPAIQSASISPASHLPTVPTPALQVEALTPASPNP